MRLSEPEKKLETQNELFRIDAKKMYADAKKYGLFTVERNERSTVAGTLELIEAHLGL